MKKLLSTKDQRIIEAAVASAEGKTSGEIVPYVIRRSGRYREAVWKAASIFGVTAVALIFGMSLLYEGWAYGWLFTFSGSASVILVSGLIGSLVAHFIPAVSRLLITEASMNEAVRNRSARAFVEEEVFATRDRTGILIFVSLYERRVEVVGDSAINERVDAETWAYVVEDILLGIQSGNLASGLSDAIERCGLVLSEHDLSIRDDDENELSNRVRIQDL